MRPSSKPACLLNGTDALFGLDATQSTCVNLAGLSSDTPFRYKVLMVAPDRHFCLVIKATDHLLFCVLVLKKKTFLSKTIQKIISEVPPFLVPALGFPLPHLASCAVENREGKGDRVFL